MSFKPVMDPIYSDYGSKTVVYEDGEGHRKTVTTRDTQAVAKDNAKARESVRKATRFFNDDATVVARVTINQMIEHPEWAQDPKAFERWLDENPDYKVLPVSFTRVTQRRAQLSEKGRENLGRILKGS